jgi:hypothetical protein
MGTTLLVETALDTAPHRTQIAQVRNGAADFHRAFPAGEGG